MFCFSLSGLFLLTGLVGRQLDISTCNCSKYFAVHRLFPVEHFQCLELSEVQNSTAAVLLRQPFYENSYTDAVCFKVAYRSLCLIIFLKANTSQSLLILLSRSLTRNTKRKSMSWGGGNWISFISRISILFRKSFQQSIIPTYSWYLFKNIPLWFYTQLLATCLTLVMTHGNDSWKMRHLNLPFLFAKIPKRRWYSCPRTEWKTAGSTVLIIESLLFIIIYQLWNLIEILKFAIKYLSLNELIVYQCLYA